MPRFVKLSNCPSPATLRAYGTSTLSFLARQSVTEHLAACEFCGAELSLISRHAPTAETLDPHVAEVAPPMPFALRLLAESMLGKMTSANRAEEKRAA